MYKEYLKAQHSNKFQLTTKFIYYIFKQGKLKKKTLIDLGCGSVPLMTCLAVKYKSSSIIGIDIEFNLLKKTNNL